MAGRWQLSQSNLGDFVFVFFLGVGRHDPTVGADQIRANANDELRGCIVDIFLMPPSMAVLESRLHKRNTETAEQLAIRLENARAEMARWKDYRYTIVSGSPLDDLENFRAIMTAERMRCERLDLSF